MKNLLENSRFLMFMIVVFMGFTSCKNEFINVIPNVEELVFDHRGGYEVLGVVCNKAWYIDGKPADWYKVKVTNDVIEITVSANNTFHDRRAQLKLVSAGKSRVINLFVRSKSLISRQKVDLGLSVKWAGWNIGATSPEEYGSYFAWGEITDKTTYAMKNYKYWMDSNGNGDLDIDEITHIGYNISGTRYDVAHSCWGAGWRMPTLDEIKELVEKCTWERGGYKGVNGQYVTGPNGNSIFLPAAGMCLDGEFVAQGMRAYYWSATSGKEIYTSPYQLIFKDSSVWIDRCTAFYFGQSVRAVTE